MLEPLAVFFGVEKTQQLTGVIVSESSINACVRALQHMCIVPPPTVGRVFLALMACNWCTQKFLRLVRPFYPVLFQLHFFLLGGVKLLKRSVYELLLTVLKVDFFFLGFI